METKIVVEALKRQIKELDNKSARYRNLSDEAELEIVRIEAAIEKLEQQEQEFQTAREAMQTGNATSSNNGI
jgi:hypothetical protein